jgi:hypothetical protein
LSNAGNFEALEVGDEVSLYDTNPGRTYYDMYRFVCRIRVTALTENMITTSDGRRWSRRNGAQVGPRANKSVRMPSDDDNITAKRDATEKAKAIENAKTKGGA